MPSSQNKSPDSFIYFEIGTMLIKRRNTAENLDAIYSRYTNVHKLTKKEFYSKLAERKDMRG